MTTVEIPESVTEIGSYAFSYCKSLSSIDIPNSVTKLGIGVFSNTNLSSVDLSSSITEIPPFAYHSCESLKEISIPNNIKSISVVAFGDCPFLEKVILPTSIEYIDAHAFTGPSAFIEKPGAYEQRHIYVAWQEPPTVHENAFCAEDDCIKKHVLHVPYGTTDNYRNTQGWDAFDLYEEYEPSGIFDTHITDANSPIYSIDGRRLESTPDHGIFIQNGKKVIK